MDEGSGSLMPLAQLDVCDQRFLCMEKRTARSGRGMSSMFDLPLIGSGTVCWVSEEPSSSEGGEGINDSSISESSMVDKWVRQGYGLSLYTPGHAHCCGSMSKLDVRWVPLWAEFARVDSQTPPAL